MLRKTENDGVYQRALSGFRQGSRLCGPRTGAKARQRVPRLPVGNVERELSERARALDGEAARLKQEGDLIEALAPAAMKAREKGALHEGSPQRRARRGITTKDTARVQWFVNKRGL